LILNIFIILHHPCPLIFFSSKQTDNGVRDLFRLGVQSKNCALGVWSSDVLGMCQGMDCGEGTDRLSHVQEAHCLLFQGNAVQEVFPPPRQVLSIYYAGTSPGRRWYLCRRPPSCPGPLLLSLYQSLATTRHEGPHSSSQVFHLRCPAVQ